MKRILLLTLLITAGCMARPLRVMADPNCPAQEFGDLGGYNLDYIAVDPVSKRHLRLPRTFSGYVGEPITVSGTVCDDDPNDILTLTWLDGNNVIPIDPNSGGFSVGVATNGDPISVWSTGTWSFEVTFYSAGTKFINMAVEDRMELIAGTPTEKDPNDIAKRIGTYAVFVKEKPEKPKNRPPVLW